MSARLLQAIAVEKPWGRDPLPPRFGAASGRIGEIWFEPPPESPQLLVKYLFTSERLSVQVHPTDRQAAAAGLGLGGKEECWLVVEAEAPAVLGIGFRKEYGREAIRAAALDGSIVDMLEWHEVGPGDFIYVPAGTVHAIGAGLTLVEVQQASDVTYRLFDYGRPRELHLDAAIEVLHPAPHDARLRRKAAPGRLVDGPYFTLDLAQGPGSAAGGAQIIPLGGEVSAEGVTAGAGQCLFLSAPAALAAASTTRYLVGRPFDS